MDTSHLITAIVSAVVGVLAKELVTWIITLVKGAAAAHSFKAKLGAVFSKENRPIMLSVLNVAVMLAVLLNFARSDAPPTRFEIMLIVGVVVFLFLAVFDLLYEITALVVRRKRAREKAVGDKPAA